MRRSFAIIAVAVMMTIALIPILEDSEADSTKTTVEGYFYNEIKDLSEVTQVEISVYHWDGITENSTLLGKYTKPLEPAKDAGGKTISNVYKFSLMLDKNITEKSQTYVYFNIGGFSIISVSGNLITPPITNLPAEMLGSTTKLTAYRILGSGAVTDSLFSLNTTLTPIGLKSATGTVTGKVMTDAKEPVLLNGVKVSLYDLSTGKELIAAYTSNGEYTITYSTGTYGIKYELDNYDAKTSTVTLTDGKILEAQDVTLKGNLSWFGLDLPHVLMLFGGFFAILLLIIISAYRISAGKKLKKKA